MTQGPASAELATVHGAPVRYLDPVWVDALAGMLCEEVPGLELATSA